MGRAILLPLLAWHVTGQPASIFLKTCDDDDMATIQSMLDQGCTNPGCHVVWLNIFCIVVPNVNKTHVKKRTRITVYTQLYLTCKNSYMFLMYIYSHRQAGCRTLSCVKINVCEFVGP